jgi:hypothetical protein
MPLKAYFFLLQHKMFRYTLFLSLAGCSNNTDSQQVPKDNLKENVSVQEIIYKSYGGEMGYSMTLHMTKDSLFYFYSLAINNKNSQLATINTIQFWDSLTTNFDIANFKKIKNGYSNQPVDGTDEEITIITNTLDTISVVNAYQDTLHYKPIAVFEQLIRKKANTLN